MEHIFVGYESAFEYWRGARTRETRECRPSNVRSLSSSTASAVAVQLGRELSPLLSGLTSPLHVMVNTQGKRLRSSDVIAHSCSVKMPPHSFCTLDTDGYLASPELALVQHAPTVGFYQLLLDAYALCGTYVIDPEDTRGFADREPITSTQRLSAFVRAGHDLQGAYILSRALRYLANGSASPQESILTLLLCLPRAQGGYGLPLPLLNARVDVPPRLRPLVEKDWYMPDLYWPTHRVAAEYNSMAFHTGAQNIANDSKRTKDFGTLGIRLITVTWDEVRDSALTDRVARHIAKLMGRRLRAGTRAHKLASRELRAQILPHRA